MDQLREATAHYSVENDDKKDGRDERTYLALPRLHALFLMQRNVSHGI